MRRVFVALLPLASLGCMIPPELPPGAQISCASQDDCPSDTECRTTLGRCVPVGSEEAPPALSSPIAAEPPLARAGVDVTLRFSVDKTLGRAPKLSVVFSDATSVDVAVEETEPGRYQGTVPVDEDTAEGLASVLLELLGADGNPARIERPGLFRVDSTAPSVVLARAEQPLYGAGDTPVLRVELDEPLDLTRTHATVTRVADDGSTHEVTDLFLPLQLAGQGTSLLLLGARTLTVDDDGRYQVELTATDLADNESAPLEVSCDGPCLEVDAIAPGAILDAAYRAGAADALDRDRIGVLAGYNELVIEATLVPDSDEEELELLVTVGGTPATEGCVASGANTWTCRHRSDPNDPGGHRPVVVTVIDEAGNRGGAEAAIVLDATGPAPLGLAQLQRDDGHVRAHLAVDHVLLNRARVSGEAGPPGVLVSLYLNEPLDDEAPPSFVLRRDGEADRPLTLEDGWASDAALVRARYASSGDEPEGAYAVVLTARDRLGNESEVTVGTITVDETPPALEPSFVAEHVVHERRPWGEAGAPGPHFAVRFDDAVEPEVTVRVFSDADLTSAQLLGEANADSDGVVQPVVLTVRDVPAVFLVLRDRAGNALSTPVRVHRQRWIASFGAAPSPSPHAAVATTRVLERSAVAARPYGRSLDDERTRLATGSLDLTDALVVTSAAPDDWVAQARVPVGEPRAGWFDPAAGTTRWLYGTTVWEDHHDPRVVAEVDALLDGRPHERGAAAVAGPRTGDGVFLYGGQLDLRANLPCPTDSGPNGTCALNDLWRFTGGEWQQLEEIGPWSPGAAPAPRLYPALGYDEARGVLVLFGGYAVGGAEAEDCRDDVGGVVLPDADDDWQGYACNDLWEHDGTQWTRVSASGPAWPEERSGARFAWDPVSGALHLYGGYWYPDTGSPCPPDANYSFDCAATDVWRYDDGAFTEVFGGLGPVSPGDGFAFSSARGALVAGIYGDHGVTLYELAGSSLVLVDDAAPPCTFVLAPVSGGLDAVAAGGACPAFTVFDGDSASVTSSPPDGPLRALPVTSTGAFGRSWSVTTERDFLTSTQRVWLWDGDAFEEAPFSFPHRFNPHLVFDAAAGEWLFFGGRDPGGAFLQLLVTHAFDDTFTPVVRESSYLSTSQAAAWYEPSLERVVVVGLTHTSYSDTSGTHGVRVLERDGAAAAWSDCADASVPSAFCGGPLEGRVGLAVAHDPVAGLTLAYGGRSSDDDCAGAVTLASGGAFVHACADTWLWNGAAWTPVSVVDDEGDGEPGPLIASALAYDPARGLVLAAVDVREQGSVWTFDGDSWRRLVPAADGERDGAPAPQGPTLSYDHVRGALLLSDTSGPGVWALESNHDERRPGVLATFDLAAADVPSLSTTITGLALRATAGASGADGEGVELALFDESLGAWHTVASSGQGASGLGPLEGAATGSLDRFLPRTLGPQDVVRARLSPTHGAGPQADGAQLVVTRLELVVDFDLDLESTSGEGE